MVNVPTMFVEMNGAGSCSELSTCDSAAKWTTTSDSATSLSTSGASQMSPCTKSTEPSAGRLSRCPA